VIRWWVGLWIAGCAGVGAPPLVSGGSPSSAPQCPEGTSLVVAPPGDGEHRVAPDTEVQTCVDDAGRPSGGHLERWPGGGVAVEGAWKDGLRDGTWTRWYADGAFRSQVSYTAGQQHGERLELGRDGRIVRIEMEGGAASELRALQENAPMPEWEGGERIEGTRYRSHARATP
jgi:hypothetical protein